MATTSPASIAERLRALRARMAEHNLDVYLVPSADEHQNEFLPDYKLRREAVSGFSGSAGDVAVPREGRAHLFVDSRYHLQAEQQVDAELYQVHKLGVEGEADLPGWLAGLERGGDDGAPVRVGFDPYLLPTRMARQLAGALRHADSALVPVPGNLVDAVWAERPPAPHTRVYALPDRLAGESAQDKLARVRAEMQAAGADALLVTRLDEIAWLCNLRGSDIPCNPVFEAYLIVEPERVLCFTDNPLQPEARQGLGGVVDFRSYDAYEHAVRDLAAAGKRLWLDPAGTTEGSRLLAGQAAAVTAQSPLVGMKARKNPVEVEVSRDAHIRAGAAKTRALSTLQSWVAEGRRVSEADFAGMLYDEYAAEEQFTDLSFPTICGYGEHSAIVHYGTPDPGTTLEEGGLLLVDSGVQILGATTDATRTVAIGRPTDEQRRHFTDVLRGHIRLALQVFPSGTTGAMLDALARAPLWNEGADYGHGTGHGVGAFLNVHEGPQNISPRGNVPLEPGMIVSNEPGYYRAGWGGIRCENLYVVEEALGMAPHPGGKRWLRLSPLTMIPFDQRLVDWRRLNPDERDWLNDYHALVAQFLAPRLPEHHRLWLEEACRPGT